MASLGSETIRVFIRKCPVLDNHCHNLVGDDSPYPYKKWFTEAEGNALIDAENTIAFKRSLREISEVYGTEPRLEAVEAKRKAMGVEAVTGKFLELANIAGLLVDDGLSLPQMQPLDWHRKFVPVVHQVLRIEAVAEDILNKGQKWSLENFAAAFLGAVDPVPEAVVAFKSIVAYRCGLNVDPTVTAQQAESGLKADLARGRPVRLTDKRILNYLFILALEVAVKADLPFQVHTGFGDRDLDLLLANPLHLRAVLEDPRFATCRIVLLHCSYPYMRQASYLASVYAQVYLDFGLIFSKLTVHAMESAAHDLFDQTPLNKAMYSSDGHGFAESFFIGAKWGREMLTRVLCRSYENGELTLPEALGAAQDILLRNAVRMYRLSISPNSISANQLEPPGTATPATSSAPAGKLALASSAKFVRLLYTTGCGQRRVRVVPAARFSSTVASHGVGLTKACMGATSFSDAPAPGSGVSGVGEIRLMPDLATRRSLPWCPEHDVVVADMHSAPGAPWELCPRSTLARVSATLQRDFGLELQAGFETEFYLLRPDRGMTKADESLYCSSSSMDAMAPLLTECASALAAMGIPVEQMHAESGGGQYEVAYTHAAAVDSADRVTFVREALASVARQHGLHASFLPLCFEGEAASGSHIHCSLWRGSQNVFSARGELLGQTKHGMSATGQHFMAGVLEHLPAVLAFTAPLPVSYGRLQPNMWAGAFQCWGAQNREAALRTCGPPGADSTEVSNFELKASDACSNPYLALAAVTAAGLDGLRRALVLPHPVDSNPAELPQGTVSRLPGSLQEAVAALQKDTILTEILGQGLCRCIVAVRQAEVEFYAGKEHAAVAPSLILKY